MENNNLSDLSQNDRIIPLLNLLIAIIFAACCLFLILIFDGYGTVKLDVPNNDSVSINGHFTSARDIKMRSGSYQITISSPTITPYQGTIQVNLFKTTVFSPLLQPRTPDAIASSLIGATSGGTAPQLGAVEWLDSKTWVVGLVVPGNADLAMHYDYSTSQWVVGFYNTDGYPDSLPGLPNDVAAYIEQLETQNVGE